LEKFADHDGRLTVRSKRAGTITRPLPGEALTRRYYYSQPVDGKNNADHKIETDLFGKIESRFPELFSSLISGDTEIDTELLLHTILMFRSRSPAFREAFELGLADLVERVSRSIPRTEFPPPPAEIPDIWDRIIIAIDPHRSIQAMAYYINNYATPLARFEWCLKFTPGKTRLPTSDNPVIWYENGFGSKIPSIYTDVVTNNTRAIFPLSREAVLVGRRSRTGDFRYIGHAGELSIRQLHEINALQVSCAWDGIVGTVSLPSALMMRLTKLAPRIDIERFDPETGAYLISSTYLDGLRKKHKFTARG
jgi:hypothetical protein